MFKNLVLSLICAGLAGCAALSPDPQVIGTVDTYPSSDTPQLYLKSFPQYENLETGPYLTTWVLHLENTPHKARWGYVYVRHVDDMSYLLRTYRSVPYTKFGAFRYHPSVPPLYVGWNKYWNPEIQALQKKEPELFLFVIDLDSAETAE